ncbi:MAG: metallophosphoesterase family protein [Candidatus Binataceae bacterium]
MKIVSFGDVHMATRNLQRMDAVMRDTDLVIVSGDLTNFGGADDARKVIDEVRRVCPQVLAVPGNLDQREVFPWLETERIALHGRGVIAGGVAIFGCGGSNLTPFGTPSEFSEAEIYDALHRGYAEVRDQRPLLMICHTPPAETKCDRITGGQAVGSPAVRRFIEEVRPDACVSGHIHESAGVDTIGPTTILNAGPFKGGGYVVVISDGARLEARLEFL